MSEAIYIQKGESINYKNDTEEVIKENTIIPIKTRIGITGTRLNPGEGGSIHVVGIFSLPKKAEEEIELGTEVYFDGDTITSIKDSNIPAGYAVANAAAADTRVLVKLLG